MPKILSQSNHQGAIKHWRIRNRIIVLHFLKVSCSSLSSKNGWNRSRRPNIRYCMTLRVRIMLLSNPIFKTWNLAILSTKLTNKPKNMAKIKTSQEAFNISQRACKPLIRRLAMQSPRRKRSRLTS